MNVTHFASRAAFRRWLEQHHNTERELVVGFYNKASGRGGLTYAEALDEALCFGWIDGIKRRVDADSYSLRFTPRRRGSNWSRVNVAHVARLRREGRMHPAGEAAFAARDPKKTALQSRERESATFPAALEKQFRAHARAWAFWEKQPPGYRRLATFFVIGAKQEATRVRRLARLIADSAAQRRIGVLQRPDTSAPRQP